jgi:hypothetical protein
MYEPLPLLFKYKCELNGYLYLTKFLNKKYNIEYNELVPFTLSINTNIDTSQVLKYRNIYFIDFKKIKLVDNENIFKFIKLILITNTKTNYQFIKYDFNIIILMNLNYINELFISKLTNIIEKYQENNNFIMFSNNTKLTNKKFHKLITLSTIIRLKPFKEFNLKYTINEKHIFELTGNNITKTELLIKVAEKQSIKITKLKPYEIYNFICNNLLIYNIINTYLSSPKIFDLSFNLLSMFSLREIITVIINIISYSTLNKLNNSYNLYNKYNSESELKLIEISNIAGLLDNNTSNLIKLKKFLGDVTSLFCYTLKN